MTGPSPTRVTDGNHAWRDSAECLGYDTELFYVLGNPPESTRAVCRRCPVQTECLDFAMSMEGNDVTGISRHGIFGGLSAQQRGQHRRQMNKVTPTPPLEETA